MGGKEGNEERASKRPKRPIRACPARPRAALPGPASPGPADAPKPPGPHFCPSAPRDRPALAVSTAPARAPAPAPLSPPQPPGARPDPTPPPTETGSSALRGLTRLRHGRAGRPDRSRARRRPAPRSPRPARRPARAPLTSTAARPLWPSGRPPPRLSLPPRSGRAAQALPRLAAAASAASRDRTAPAAPVGLSLLAAGRRAPPRTPFNAPHWAKWIRPLVRTRDSAGRALVAALVNQKGTTYLVG